MNHNLLLQMRENFITKAGYWADNIRSMAVSDNAYYAEISIGKSSDTFNVLIPRGGDVNVAAQGLAQFIQNHCLSGQAASAWVWHGEHMKGWLSALGLGGFTEAEMNSAMIRRNQTPITPLRVEGLVITQVTTPKDIITFGEVISSLFIDPLEAKNILSFYTQLSKTSPELTRNVQLFLGTYKGEPVATSSLCYDKRMVGLYDVGVRPDLQGLGIAKAMTRNLIQAAEVFKAPISLSATPDGEHIYTKLGFEKIGDVLIFNIQAHQE